MVSKIFDTRKKCPFCSHNKSKILLHRRLDSTEMIKFFKNHLSKKFPKTILKNQNFIIMECENCSGIYQKNILNSAYIKKFYEKYVPQKESFNKKKINKKYLNKVFNYETSLIQEYFKNDRKIDVLEIGAGWGFWSINAKKMFNTTATEISKTRRKFIKKNNIEVFDSLNKINKKFNFIYSDQTFEHLNFPFLELKSAVKLLKKKGIIFLKVPPGIYIKKKLTNDYKISADEISPLEHVNVFNRKTNLILAKKLKLQYLYPKNIYPLFSLLYFKKSISNFYEFFSSKTIIFRKN